jgi:hypothetical protein
MGFFSDLNPVTGLVKGIGNAVSGVAKVFVGDKSARDSQDSASNMATLNQFAAEFGRGKTWFDSLIDGINRLPRPFLALGVLGLLVWAPMDPLGFLGPGLAGYVVRGDCGVLLRRSASGAKVEIQWTKCRTGRQGDLQSKGPEGLGSPRKCVPTPAF